MARISDWTRMSISSLRTHTPRSSMPVPSPIRRSSSNFVPEATTAARKSMLPITPAFCIAETAERLCSPCLVPTLRPLTHAAHTTAGGAKAAPATMSAWTSWTSCSRAISRSSGTIPQLSWNAFRMPSSSSRNGNRRLEMPLTLWSVSSPKARSNSRPCTSVS